MKIRVTLNSHVPLPANDLLQSALNLHHIVLEVSVSFLPFQPPTRTEREIHLSLKLPLGRTPFRQVF